MSPFAPAVLVFEKSPKWEAELKRRLAGPCLLVRPCRSAGDVLALCRQAPESVVVIDLAAGAADCLKLLESIALERLKACAVAIGSREMSELEWPIRELGAADFVSECVGGEALAQICRGMLKPAPPPVRKDGSLASGGR